MIDQLPQTDINTASSEDLMHLPGVGITMAERIIAGRPYSSVEDLCQVNGIGPVVLEQLRPYITNSEVMTKSFETTAPLPETLEKSATAQLSGNHKESDHEEGGSEVEMQSEESPTSLNGAEAGIPEPEAIDERGPGEPEPEPTEEAGTRAGVFPASEERPVTPEIPTEDRTRITQANLAAPATKYVTRSQAFLMAIGSGLLAFILAIAASLGLLLLVNGGLSYVGPGQFSTIRNQVDGLNSQATLIQQDLSGLRNRVDNLEGLSGRVSSVEQDTKQLRGDLDTVTTHANQLEQQVSGLASTVDALQKSTSRFQNFLDGLRQLLANINQP